MVQRIALCMESNITDHAAIPDIKFESILILWP